MTCIVGLIDDGRIYMGGDSAGVSNTSLSIRADHKVFIKDDFIMGFTTSFRMGQLLQYKLRIPNHPKAFDTFEYMVSSFVEAVRKCLKDGGFAEKKDEQEKAGTFLVGYQGRLFHIHSDYQVGETLLPFAATGCGEDLALGALFANAHLKPKERILQALEAGEQFSTGIRRPFLIKELKSSTLETSKTDDKSR